jgi:hypothetical protein
MIFGWFTQEMIEGLRAQGLDMSHVVPVSGTARTLSPTDEEWAAWLKAMKEYADKTGASGLEKLNFWIIIKLPKKFGDKLEWHEEVPMIMPAPGVGELLGIAKDKNELQNILEDNSDCAHLVYKVKIQGQAAWRSLVEFMAKNNMLEHER